MIAYNFWSPTCAPCKAIKPALSMVQEEFPEFEWVSVNTHDDKDDLATKFNVSVVPTMVVISIKDNKLVFKDSYSGTAIANYYRILRNAMKQS